MRELSAAVVVCTRRRPESIEASLPHLVAAAGAAGAGLVVVEQGGRAAEAMARAAGAVYLADAGRGVSRARNLAARATRSDVVVFTDDDCLVPERWVLDHLAALTADPGLAATFGRVSGLPRHEEDRDDADPVGRRGLHRAGARPWDVGHSSNMAVLASALAGVGGFDERLGPGGRGVQAGEDADLIARLLAAGHVLASGVGEPVRHADWRSAAEDAATLRAYESGAGAWIGAALRARHRPSAIGHLRARWWMVRPRSAELFAGGRPVDAVRLPLALLAGVVRGAARRPWPTGGVAQE